MEREKEIERERKKEIELRGMGGGMKTIERDRYNIYI